MSVTLFIQEHSGDYNFDQEFLDRTGAVKECMRIKDYGGYWVDRGKNTRIFIPWHRIDRMEVFE